MMDKDELELDYWLRSISERYAIQLGIDAPRFFCCNLKQTAHFWDGVQDSVLPVISREKKGKVLAL